MRILVISDMHGDLANVRRLLTEATWDLVLCCGDWGDPGQLADVEYENILDLATIYTVFGNHDDIDTLKRLRNRDGSAVLLQDGKPTKAKGVTIVGVSGIWAKSHRLPWYVTDEDIASYGPFVESVDILMTHGCAIGLNDLTPGGGRGGHRQFTELFAGIQPRVYVCGHLHRAQARRLKSGPWVANAGNTAEGDYLAVTASPEEWQVERGHL